MLRGKLSNYDLPPLSRRTFGFRSNIVGARVRLLTVIFGDRSARINQAHQRSYDFLLLNCEVIVRIEFFMRHSSFGTFYDKPKKAARRTYTKLIYLYFQAHYEF